MSFAARLALEGRVLLVSGAGHAAGAAIAMRAARRGAALILVDPDAAALARLSVRIPVAAGVAPPRCLSPERLGEVADAVDLLANVAGPIRMPSLDAMSPADWAEMQSAPMRQVFEACGALLPTMARNGRGAIVTVTPPAAGAAGSGLRANLVGLTRALAREAAPLGVRVNAVDPGPTGALPADAGPLPADAGTLESGIADAALFLLSDAAAYVTGETLTVGTRPRVAAYHPADHDPRTIAHG